MCDEWYGVCELSRDLHVVASQVMLPALAENDVTIQIKACGLSRIDTKVN